MNRLQSVSASVRKHLASTAMILLAGMFAIVPWRSFSVGIAGTGKAAHVNVAILHVWNGGKPPTSIDEPDVAGLLTSLRGRAQVLTLTHTTGVKDNDVLNIQSDILREGASAEDFGVDCQLILHIDHGEKVSLAGKCEVFVYDIPHQRQMEAKLIVKPTPVGEHWTLVGWDGKDQVAIYVNEEVGLE